MAIPIEKYHFLSFEEAATPKGHIIYNYSNSWWVVHPEKGLAFYGKGFGSPQCNKDESLSRWLCPEWGEIRFIETVFAPCDVNDYRE